MRFRRRSMNKRLWLITLLSICLILGAYLNVCASTYLTKDYRSVTTILQKTKPKTVIDYYLRLPNQYTLDVSLKRRKELLENSGRTTKDIANGYLNISGDAGDPGITIALFKKSNQEYLIAVAPYDEITDSLYLLEYSDKGEWKDVTKTLIPNISKQLSYALPQYGTAIKVTNENGEFLYTLDWSNDQFLLKNSPSPRPK